MKKRLFSALAIFAAATNARETMNILIQTDNPDTVIKATLADNATARDFYAQLPLRMKLKDYAGSEKIGTDIPKRLSTADAPKGYEGKQGDLTYYAPWGNLAIFYKDSHVGYADGLVYFGRIESGLARLEKLEGEVLISALKE